MSRKIGKKLGEKLGSEAFHSSASALHNIGVIDKTTMRRFDAAAFKKTP